MMPAGSALSGKLRVALGHYATGVAIVTVAAAGGAPVGLTINSFSSVSLDPPLVLWCLQRRAERYSAFARARHFAVNVLAAGQEHLARQFAAGSPERFAGLAWQRGPRGLPVLDDCLAAFVCSRAGQFRGGDHRILIGALEEYAVTEGASPLIFYHGQFGAIEAAPDGHSGLLAAAAASTTANLERRERQ